MSVLSDPVPASAGLDRTEPSASLLALGDLLAGGGVLALTGAGISTESGIPDYRGPSGALHRHTPMTHQQFTGSGDARRRYWARSHAGWSRVALAGPNEGHRALAELEHAGLVSGVVTQNVDGLHQAAGSERVVELHGSLADVVCLACGARSGRAELDARLSAANPAARTAPLAVPAEINPDGDVDLPDEALRGFVTVPCLRCGADALKPDVVFFGDTVPRDRVERCFAAVDAASALLVLGSSLTVMSGYRFVLHAVRRGIVVAVVNDGATRGDRHADVLVGDRLGSVLPRLAAVAHPGTGRS